MSSSEKARLLDPLEWAGTGLAATDADAAGAWFAPRMDALGFENVGFAFDISRSVPAVPAQDEMHGCLVSQAWHEYYLDNAHLLRHDPLARHLFASEAPAFALPDQHPSVAVRHPEEVALLRRVYDFGMRGTFAFSCFDRTQGTLSTFVAVTFFNNREFVHSVLTHAHQLQLAFEYLIEGMRLRVSQRAMMKPLSPRERECLLWAAVGKTTKEIADRLTLTNSTVDSYIAAAMRKLGCTTRAQACVRAMLLGQIAP